jgi:2-keto-4-pentenoate hydratase/2-oxohepta-3-ene-1,7-dioic acid hydratase in catechol pathway
MQTRCALDVPRRYSLGKAANYSDHMQEMARVTGLPPGPNMKELGEMPWHFIKSLAYQPWLAPTQKSRFLITPKMLDWEIELAVVIGKTCSQVSARRC